jgi:DNA (cytosine-5)-methyltransferase 1
MIKEKLTFGSVCSGIEASRLAFAPYGFKQLWSSEIAEFPSKVLEHHFPEVTNDAPDIMCGGTPCQAFSLAGWQNGLADERGQLTMTFIEIANAIDKIRLEEKKNKSIILWENVEGVLNDRTNAFGNFIAGLAGFKQEIKISKWTKAGFLEGPDRNVAWRVIDAKYFGLPQQRRRLYVLAGGKTFKPDQVLFEFDSKDVTKSLKLNSKKVKEPTLSLFSDLSSNEYNTDRIFYKDGVKFQIFREYTDCLYSAYGTKWNGNAAAYNGSLYVAQNDRIRRFTPLECERLMGFPDNYTKVNGNSHTNRFQAVGNSWAVPVVDWIGSRIKIFDSDNNFELNDWTKYINHKNNNLHTELFLLGDVYLLSQSQFLNTSTVPNNPVSGDLKDIVEPESALEKFYLTPKACAGILRRKEERNIRMNPDLEKLMVKISQEDE